MLPPVIAPDSESLHWRLLTDELDVRKRWREVCDDAVRRQSAGHLVTTQPAAPVVVSPAGHAGSGR